jgi:hypothetical protein
MDMMFLRVMIGNQDYHLAGELDSELISKSHGVQSLVSAMTGTVERMLYEVAEGVMKKRERRDGKCVDSPPKKVTKKVVWQNFYSLRARFADSPDAVLRSLMFSVESGECYGTEEEARNSVNGDNYIGTFSTTILAEEQS